VLEQALIGSRRPLEPPVVAFLELLASTKVIFHARQFVVDPDPLSDEPPRFHFDYSANHRRQQLDIVWSEPVERQLLERKIAMATPEHEALRGGTLLLSALQYIDLPYGKDYVDAVLWEAVKARYGAFPSIRQLLDQIPHIRASRSQSYGDCMFQIEHMLDGYGGSLVTQLDYSKKAAYPIVVAAVYHMLDRRHLISARKVLFPDW
jgi:hypothetical protein